MLFGLGVSCRILYSIVSYLYIAEADQGSLLVIMLFLFGRVSSSSWCLGWAA